MKVLVTGGTGFIGTKVVERLVKLGHTPLILDHHNRTIEQRYGLASDEIETFYGDIRDDIIVEEAVAHADGVIHLAAVLGTQETIANPRPAAHTNILGSLNVFSAVHHYELPAVYIAVGNHWMNNTYSISKTTAERFAFMFNAELDTRIAVVRALNAYGPGQEPTAPWGTSKVRKIMPAFICRALDNRPIEVYGNGSQMTDMIHVRDVAAILVDALTIEHGIYDTVFEAGTGRRTTANDIAQTIINLTGQGSVKHLPMRPGEPDNAIVLGDPLTLAPLEWDEQRMIPLTDGIAETVDYFRNKYFNDVE